MLRRNDDLGLPNAMIDREIMAELVLTTFSKKINQSQYTVKERTQCIDADRFLITKKVNPSALPDPSRLQPVINDQFRTKIEKTAAEMHEAYL